MEKEIYKRSLFQKFCMWLFNVFSAWSIYIFYPDKQSRFLVIPMICILIFCLLYTLFIYVKYIFTNEQIILKYPFLKEKIYNINEIVGFEVYRKDFDNFFIIYFNNNKKVKIEIASKKFKEKVKIIYERYYKIISDKNIDKIKTNGFEVCFSKNKLIFFDNRVEILGKYNKIYYYNNDLKNIRYFEMVNQYKRIDILAKDNYLIKLLSYKCKGGIGLFEYLLDRIKCPNIA